MMMHFRWVDAIELSAKTIKQQSKSISGQLKVNIDKILNIYDVQGPEKFKEKIQLDYSKVQAEYEVSE